MLSHVRVLSARPARSWAIASGSRHISHEASDASDAPEREITLSSPPRKSALRAKEPTFEEWAIVQGQKFRTAGWPNNWLGNGVPFPLNPTFRPPTPISDKLRSIIYDEYMSDPAVYTVRKLAERYNLSLRRVDAILRLKGLEAHWKKGKPLQTGFLAGMEWHLGVSQTVPAKTALRKASDELGADARSADLQSENAEKDHARERYHRLFWEPVVEGQDPIMPGQLEVENTPSKVVDHAKAALLKGLFPQHTQSPKQRVVPIEGRPTLKFVDVGPKFLDVKDRVRRDKEIERRAKVRSRRRGGKAEISEKVAA